MMQYVASQGVTVRAVRAFRFADRTTFALTSLWRRLTRLLGTGYRPERHYMRGPGPKWRARNSQRFGAINDDPHRRNDNRPQARRGDFNRRGKGSRQSN
jgi:hypothetical protein